MQKEAYFFNKFCLTIRDETEWIELIKNGYNFLVGSNYSKIIESFNLLKTKNFEKSTALYGNGDASKKIVKELLNF
jgi:UDP-GlcNAc3NAcA epimerase